MRKNNPIDVLFPKIRQRIFAITFGQPDRWWYLSELAKQMRASPSSLQRELTSLADSGILRKKREGNRLYFQVETNSSIYLPLRELIEQTLGVIPALTSLLLTLKKEIQFAFIYGSMARQEEHALSDVDIIIIGSVGLISLSSELRNLERKFNREFNVKCYSTAEFISKMRSSNHFLTTVLKEKKTFIIGNEDELARLIK